MRKAITVWLIALIGLMGMSGASLQAQATSGTAGPLTWTYDTGTKTLTISGTGEMPDYWGWQGMPWKEFEEAMTQVVIGDGVTKIGNFAFHGAKRLVSVKFPASSLTQIGENAFGYCQKLELSALPEGLVRIGRSAFTDCDKLSLVTFPESLEEIGDEGFFQCGNLRSVTIPTGVKKIGVAAFSGCKNLEAITVDGRNTEYVSENGVLFDKNKTVLMLHPTKRPWTKYDIPSGVKKIDKGAFNGCHNLTTVTIPNGLTSIEERAFTYCPYLSSIAIPASVTSIKEGAIFGCWYFEGCTVAPENSHYKSVDGVLFNHDQTTLLVYPSNLEATEYVIPAGVTRIGDLAFFNINKLTSVKFSAGLKEIGEAAFQYTKLTSVSLPAGFTKISGQAFRGCINLTSVRLPAEVTEIGLFAFIGCENLKKLIVKMETPPDIESNSAFEGDLSKILLSVPTGKKANYEAKAVWKDFNIMDTKEPFEVLFPSPDMTYEARLHTIEITSERPWRASIEGEGAVFEKRIDPENIERVLAIEGEGDQTLALGVFENPSTDERTIKIIVETTDAGTPVKKEVTLKQKGWYGVLIGGVGLTPDNYEHIDDANGFTDVKNGSVTFDKDKNELTLENAVIESSGYTCPIGFSRKLTIVLEGKNQVIAKQATAISQHYDSDPLRITGDGSLYVSTERDRNAIFSYGQMTIDGGCSLDVISTIKCNTGKITIDNADVHVTGRPNSYGTLIASTGFELKGGVKLLEPKDAEIKLYDAYHDDQGNTYKHYSFLQGNTPCTEVSIGHEIKFEAKIEAEGQVAIDGGEKKVKVESDSKWKMTIPTEAASWIEVGTKTVGTNPNDSTVTLKVKSNLADGEPRSATLVFETITGKSYNAKREVKIEQEGSLIKAEWVSMNDSVLPSKKEVKQVKVKVTSNTLWEVSVPDTSNWLRIVKADNSQVKKLEGKFDGKADSTFSFLSIQDNSEYGSRMQKITFKTKDGKHTATLDMVQNGRFTLDLPTDDLGKVPADGLVEKQIIVKSEDPWKVDVTALTTLRAGSVYGLPWLKLETSPLAGGTTHDSVIKITVVPNAGTVARKAKVVFKNANDDAIMGEFKVSQIGKTPGGGGSGHSGGGSSSSGGSGRVTPPAIVSVTGLTLNKTSVVVDGNAKTVQIVATILPQNATNKSVKWVSSNSDVASVDDAGLVTIHKKGVAVITATAADGSGKTGKCSILVRSTVANAAVPEARIYAAEGLVYIALPRAATVRIYGLNGVLVRSLTAPAGLTTVALPTGIYIVRTGERTEKVLVD